MVVVGVGVMVEFVVEVGVGVGVVVAVVVAVAVAVEGGLMTLSDQLLTALVSTATSGSSLSPEEVTDWVVRYKAETGDTSLRGVAAEELMLLLLPIPHQRPGSRLGSSSMSRSLSGSWSWSRSGSGPE